MPVVFDISAFFDYFLLCKKEGTAKLDFNRAMSGFPVQKAVDKVGEVHKTVETIYVVPSVTGRKGLIKLGGKTFYEF
jgi:hypothetical protein